MREQLQKPINAMTEVSIVCPEYRCSDEIKGEGEKITRTFILEVKLLELNQED